MKLSCVILVALGLLVVGNGGNSVTAFELESEFPFHPKFPVVPALFSFGDSVADPGNNNYLPSPAFLANFTPYGETYFHVPTGRFCDGRLFIDFLAQDLGLPLLKPFLQPGNSDYSQGVNFASAGSGLLQATREGHVINFPGQFAQFKTVKSVLESQRGTVLTRLLLSRSLYVFSVGGNDIFYYLTNATAQQNVTLSDLTEQIFNAIGAGITSLYEEGARKIILGALPPGGCLPAVSVGTGDGSCDEGINGLSLAINARLPALRTSLMNKLPGLYLIIINNYDLLVDLIKNGSSYGFTKGSYACCGAGPLNALVQCGTLDAQGNKLYNLCPDSDLSQYVFWDQFHPTEKTYGILAQAFLKGQAPWTFPYNIHTLINV